MRSSLIPVDEKDFGLIMHPRKQYFQNIQDKIGGIPPPEEALMAYENSFQTLWTQRIPLTIQAGQVSSPQTNFTLLINNTFPDLIGADDKELRFTGDDSVPLPYYIQEFDSDTGRLVARFLKPTVADGDLIYIYFGNPLAIGQQDPFTVWNGMDFVYPLDSPDSTVENLVGVNSTSTNTTQVDGKIFKAVNFANGSQFIQFTSTDWTNQSNNSSLSIAFWYKTVETDRGILFGNFTLLGNNPRFNLEIADDVNKRLRMFITSRPDNVNTDTFTPTSSKYNDGEWHLVIFTYNKNTRIPRLYFDGVAEASGSARPDNSDVFFETTVAFFAGRDSRIGTTQYVGDMELLRKFNDTELTSDAISTMYNNENDDDTFYSGNAAEATPTPPIINMKYESGIPMRYSK